MVLDPPFITRMRQLVVVAADIQEVGLEQLVLEQVEAEETSSLAPM